MTHPLPGEPQRILVHPPALLPSAQAAEEREGRQSEASPRLPSDTKEARKLGTLVDVSQALAGHLNLQAGLSAMLLILAR